MPLQILIVDDHAVVRRGVRSLLESQPDWEIAGEATTGREAVELAKQLQPDIVVMDLSLPELSGLDATRHILKESPRSEIVVDYAPGEVLDVPPTHHGAFDRSDSAALTTRRREPREKSSAPAVPAGAACNG